MKVRVAWFGRPGSSPYEEQVALYRRRVARRWPAEDIALRAVAGGRDRDPVRALAAEARTAERHLPDRWPLVVLDERGQSLASRSFATRLDGFQSRGAEGLVFLLGSDLGVDETLRGRSDLMLSLGPMTLPHLLARLVLWEQLFRAADILGGGGYHRPTLQ